MTSCVTLSKLIFIVSSTNQIYHLAVYRFGNKGCVTIVADFSPEFNLQFRWRSEHQTKNHSAYQ